MNNDLTALKVDELNTELSIDELDTASGGFAWIPVVVVGLFLAGIIHKAVTHTK